MCSRVRESTHKKIYVSSVEDLIELFLKKAVFLRCHSIPW